VVTKLISYQHLPTAAFQCFLKFVYTFQRMRNRLLQQQMTPGLRRRYGYLQVQGRRIGDDHCLRLMRQSRPQVALNGKLHKFIVCQAAVTGAVEENVSLP